MKGLGDEAMSAKIEERLNELKLHQLLIIMAQHRNYSKDVCPQTVSEGSAIIMRRCDKAALKESVIV
jgi:hypothetical protein